MAYKSTSRLHSPIVILLIVIASQALSESLVYSTLRSPAKQSRPSHPYVLRFYAVIASRASESLVYSTL